MSNARSPREVCSTTIGTSGLTVLASFRFSRSNPSRSRPSGRASLSEGPLPLTRRHSSNAHAPPEPVRTSSFGRLAGGLGGLGRDRLRRLRDEVQRLALGEVLLERVEPPGRLQPLQQLLRRGAVGGLADRLEQLLLGRIDALGLDDRGEHGLAAERLLGVLLALLDDLVLLAPGDAQVRLLGDALMRERVQHLVPQLAGAGLDERL